VFRGQNGVVVTRAAKDVVCHDIVTETWPTAPVA